ncbi:hypothetical protein TGDOM2_400970 [Toxoplasma gondii GAB2-2007-GAL-DOM2]|uniref:Uncharacterized protein n=1 Tax=Toxoplasma gondii GAB2-2007-GAL-DOM2 TaxID=1130820 RepID=A0A086JJ76_TOXGO|nr:hypothetical protein TGDOM2_400970 [Toxoplasma gondii GAB2-2007-GAL-DOM2]
MAESLSLLRRCPPLLSRGRTSSPSMHACLSPGYRGSHASLPFRNGCSSKASSGPGCLRGARSGRTAGYAAGARTFSRRAFSLRGIPAGASRCGDTRPKARLSLRAGGSAGRADRGRGADSPRPSELRRPRGNAPRGPPKVGGARGSSSSRKEARSGGPRARHEAPFGPGGALPDGGRIRESGGSEEEISANDGYDAFASSRRTSTRASNKRLPGRRRPQNARHEALASRRRLCPFFSISSCVSRNPSLPYADAFLVVKDICKIHLSS